MIVQTLFALTSHLRLVLAGGKTKGKLEAANINQHRFGYIKSLKCHLAVLLGAIIDREQAPNRLRIKILLHNVF